MKSKTLIRHHPAYRDDIGDLVTRRPVPGPTIERIDPFLFLNHHGPQTYRPQNHGLPFGPHPHRGFETVTFILEGELAHCDSAGHESVIRAGGVQWMTAGRGIVHEEVSPQEFRKRGGPMEILQLWVNLPARLKMTEPRYVGLQSEQIPALTSDDARATVHLISGEWSGHRGPVHSLTGVMMSYLELKAGGRVWFPNVGGRNVLLYTVRASINVGGAALPEHALAELSDMGDAVEITAPANALVLFGHAEPLGEPVVAHGPFVMNTRDEIVDAIRDYQAGKFETMLD
jgi:quercetin 2,3-dioxygenase